MGEWKKSHEGKKGGMRKKKIQNRFQLLGPLQATRKSTKTKQENLRPPLRGLEWVKMGGK